MTLAQALAKRIDELLEQSNLTQYQLAKRSGLAQTTIADIRKMRNNGTNVSNLNAIAQGFGMDLCEFFNSRRKTSATDKYSIQKCTKEKSPWCIF